jgi:hypothetical protein
MGAEKKRVTVPADFVPDFITETQFKYMGREFGGFQKCVRKWKELLLEDKKLA